MKPVIADQRSRRAFLGFYNVVQSWSQALYQQNAFNGSTASPKRRFMTSASTKASINPHQTIVQPFSGMSLLIDSPKRSRPFKHVDQHVQLFPNTKQEYKGARFDPYQNEMLDTKTKVLKRLKSLVKEMENGQTHLSHCRFSRYDCFPIRITE